MSDIVFRPATRADLSVLIDFIHLLASDEGRPDAVSVTKDRLAALLFGPDAFGTGYLGFKGNEPLVSALVLKKFSSYRGTPILYIEDIVVSEAARGTGVGAKMMEFLAKKALEQGCEAMEWMAVEDNAGAIRFYERLGAEIDPHVVLGFDHAAMLKVSGQHND